MASCLRKVILASNFKTKCKYNRVLLTNSQPFIRRLVYEKNGAILDEPEVMRFGVIKSLVVVLPFLYIGGMFAKKAAALLEDYEVFVPEDDDDD